MVIHSIIFFTACWAIPGYAQEPSTNSPPKPPAVGAPLSTESPVPLIDLERQLNDFQRTLSENEKKHEEFLDRETESHQKFLEWHYDLCVSFIGLGVFFFGGILTFFHYKSRKDIKQTVDERVSAVIDSHIRTRTDAAIAAARLLAEAEITKAQKVTDAALNDFNTHLASHKTLIENQVKALQSEFKGSVHNSITLATALARTCALLIQPKSENPKEEENTNQERRDTIEKLKKIQMEWAPTNRTIIVFVGRLYRKLGELDSAIEALNIVIAKRDQLEETKGADAQDHSDILFNKACYLNLKAIKTGMEVFREEAWTTISQAVVIWPPNLEEAKKDDDLAGLESNTRIWEKLKQ